MYCNFHVITDLNIDIYIVLLFKDLIGRNSNCIVLDMYYSSFDFRYQIYSSNCSRMTIYFITTISDLYSTYMYCESFLGFMSSTH